MLNNFVTISSPDIFDKSMVHYTVDSSKEMLGLQLYARH